MNTRTKILALMGLWSAAVISNPASADGPLNTTRPPLPQQPAPAASSNYVYGAGTVYGPAYESAGSNRERRRHGAGNQDQHGYTPSRPYGARRDYRAGDDVIIEYSRDGYLIYRRNLERRGDGYRDDDRRRFDDRRGHGGRYRDDGRRHRSRDASREGRYRGFRQGRDNENCLGSHCYEQASSRDRERDSDKPRD